jgi:hypothetical protein
MMCMTSSTVSGSKYSLSDMLKSGQTAINLAEELSARGVKILGTSLEDLDRAEDRDNNAFRLFQINDVHDIFYRKRFKIQFV